MFDKNLKITVTEEINAPLNEVWNALTDKEKVKQYFFGTELDTTWVPGSPIIFKGDWNGKGYEDKGKILEVEERKLIKYSHLSTFSGLPDEPENYSIITYELDENNGKTLLEITQEGYRDKQSCDDSVKGWKFVLDNLKKLIE